MTRPRDIANSINRINSSAADATAVTIDSSEQVGIGTTSPAEMLHVFHASANINAIIESGDANAYLAFKDNSTSGNAHVFLGASGDNMTFFSGGSTERMRLLSGGGLTFNGDTAAANALDDYEEGDWTPGITGMTFSSSDGVYTKIGRRVQCSGILTDCTSGTASAVGAKISGLPFTVADHLSGTSLEDGGLFYYFQNLGVTTSTITVAPDDGTTEAFLYRVVGGGSTTVTTLLRTAVDASDFTCRFAFTYNST